MTEHSWSTGTDSIAALSMILPAAMLVWHAARVRTAQTLLFDNVVVLIAVGAFFGFGNLLAFRRLPQIFSIVQIALLATPLVSLVRIQLAQTCFGTTRQTRQPTLEV